MHPASPSHNPKMPVKCQVYYKAIAKRQIKLIAETNCNLAKMLQLVSIFATIIIFIFPCPLSIVAETFEAKTTSNSHEELDLSNSQSKFQYQLLDSSAQILDVANKTYDTTQNNNNNNNDKNNSNYNANAYTKSMVPSIIDEQQANPIASVSFEAAFQGKLADGNFT